MMITNLYLLFFSLRRSRDLEIGLVASINACHMFNPSDEKTLRSFEVSTPKTLNQVLKRVNNPIPC